MELSRHLCGYVPRDMAMDVCFEGSASKSYNCNIEDDADRPSFRKVPNTNTLSIDAAYFLLCPRYKLGVMKPRTIA